MLDKLLVPLDGSPLADRILTLLKRLLAQRDAQVELVQVLAPRDVEREKSPGQLSEEARKHLDGDAALLRAAGTKVETRVLVGDPAERLLLHATETNPALIVMSTHGRSGIQRWVRGSVAERVLRNAKAP